MNELIKIIQLYDSINFSERKAALATVVAVNGSSYRRPGAKMIITDDGKWEGSISGGCLEGDALRKARSVMNSGEPELITYDTSETGSDHLKFNLGCEGIIQVFIEPLRPEDLHSPIQIYRKVLLQKEEQIVATIVQDAHHELKGKRFNLSLTPPTEVPGFLIEGMNRLSEEGKSLIYECVHQHKILLVHIEKIAPQFHLIIYGAGNDVIPLAKMAIMVGWKVSVTENCLAQLIPKKFSGCDIVFPSDKPVIDASSCNAYTAAVLMSHNFHYDLSVLRELLTTDIRYIGMLGPRKKFEKIRMALEQEGTVFSENSLHKIHAPVGVDIGAETPEEIALSIVAEIKAVFSGRFAGYLKERSGPIHERGQDPILSKLKVKFVA